MVQSQTYTDLTSSSSSSLFLRHIKSHEGLCRVALNKKTLEHANLGINLDDIPVSGGFRGRNVLLAALYDGLRAHRPRDVDFIKFYKRLTATLRMMRTILLNH